MHAIDTSAYVDLEILFR